MERVRQYFETLAKKHRDLGHCESEPHFAYLQDEMGMLLPAQMGYPFLLIGHDGYVVTEDETHRRWTVLISVLTHVKDTGDDREKNRAIAICGRILDDIILRATSNPARMATKWLRGIDMSGAQAAMIENEGDALYGWAITLSITLPWCKNVDNSRWNDLRLLDEV